MNNVVTQARLKTDWLQVRIREEVKADFAIAADLRGASMSGLVLQFIMKTIREEKAASPESFAKSEQRANGTPQQERGNVVAHIGSGRSANKPEKQPSRQDVQRMITACFSRRMLSTVRPSRLWA